MRWSRGHKSSDVIDRRGQGGMRGRGGAMKLGLGGIVIALVAAYFGLDVSQFVGGGGGTSGSQASSQGGGAQQTPAENLETRSESEKRAADFMNFLMDDIQPFWERRLGGKYRRAKLVLFDQGTPTQGCGYGEGAVGPFYCPADERAYVDLTFFEELRSPKFGAPGEFAQAYVLAHEIGHHLQNVLGTSAEMRRAQKRNPRKKNELSVRLELQADCYAGVWAADAARRDRVVAKDIDQGLTAAAAVGDDTLLRKAGRRASPESFTHGSSAQRKKWFRRGFDRGDIDACDTFSGGY